MYLIISLYFFVSLSSLVKLLLLVTLVVLPALVNSANNSRADTIRGNVYRECRCLIVEFMHEYKNSPPNSKKLSTPLTSMLHL